LKQKLPKKTHCQRLENRVSEGMPDVYMCINGVVIWLELKIIKHSKVSVSKSQIAWHLGHSRCGGVSFFLLHEPSTGDVFLFDGGKVVEIHGSRIDALRPAALYEGNMSDFPAALRDAARDAWLDALRPASSEL
jgi:hypothetical protein